MLGSWLKQRMPIRRPARPAEAGDQVGHDPFERQAMERDLAVLRSSGLRIETDGCADRFAAGE